MKAVHIVTYVCTSLTLIITLFCLFKTLNLRRKVESVSDFVNGEVFSTRFQTMLSNYFADVNNTKFVFEPVLPWFRDSLEHNDADRSLNVGSVWLVE